MGPTELRRRRPVGGYRGNELVAGAVALLLPLLFVTSFRLASWAPRFVVLPLVAAVGLAVTPRVLSGPRRRPAVLALGFLAWAALATWFAPDRTVAFWGRYAVGTGLVFMAALVGAWILGASVRPSAAALVERALWTACLVNAAVAVLQQLVDLSALGLGLYQGRSQALFGNPVYLAELLVGGLWLGLCRQTRTAPGAIVGLVLIAAAVGVSGSRFALVLAVVIAVAALPRLGWRRGLGAALLIAAGLGLGTGLADVGISGGGTTGIDRAGAVPASGLRPRLETWRSALPALGHRPILGWGPSGFLAATSSRRTLAVARTEGPDHIFGDAHDIVVEAGVATGVPGLLLLLGWLGLAFAPARTGPEDRRSPPVLAGFAAAALAMMLVEPLHVGTAPLALLALGASAAAGRATENPASTTSRRAGRAAAGGLLMAGLAAGGLLMAGLLASGLIRLRQAELDNAPSAAQSAVRTLPAWAEPASVVARLESFRAIANNDAAARTEALRWYALAAHRDSEDPGPWIDWGGVLLLAGDDRGASAAFSHALARNPWSVLALLGAAHAAADLNQPQRAADLRARAALARRVG